MARSSSSSKWALGLTAAVVGIGAFLFLGGEASAEQLPDEPDDAGGGGGGGGGGELPGKGPGGAPKATGGGKTYGKPQPGAQYFQPQDWDPVRGLWIAPDCEMVVEAPGWYCGASGSMPLSGVDSCKAVEFPTYEMTMADPGNGVAGFIDFLINQEMGPDEIAYQILLGADPICAELLLTLTLDEWPLGIRAWYQSLLQRVTADWETAWGVPFEPAQG